MEQCFRVKTSDKTFGTDIYVFDISLVIALIILNSFIEDQKCITLMTLYMFGKILEQIKKNLEELFQNCSFILQGN